MTQLIILFDMHVGFHQEECFIMNKSDIKIKYLRDIAFSITSSGHTNQIVKRTNDIKVQNYANKHNSFSIRHSLIPWYTIFSIHLKNLFNSIITLVLVIK